jgi:dienelactone hydrolase
MSQGTGTRQVLSVRIPVEDAVLEGDLALPEAARGVVAFAHGSGSGRRSPRNRFVAGVLADAGFATLLLDLLTEREEEVDRYTGEFRFDIGLLASRLERAAAWLGERPETSALRIGYFGASTGGGAALVAAAREPGRVGAVVSRGGRPDMAGDFLEQVRAPTLLVVGGLDAAVIRMNREAMARLRCEKRLEIVPGATHLFEEPGALEAVAELAAGWFGRLEIG